MENLVSLINAMLLGDRRQKKSRNINSLFGKQILALTDSCLRGVYGTSL